MSDESRPSWSMFGPSLPPALIVMLAGLAMFSGREANSTARQPVTPTAALPPAAANAPARPVPSATTLPATITAEWIEARVGGSRSARLIDDYLGDVGCLSGAAALGTRGARGSSAALVGVGGQIPCDLDAVIVSVADYEDSNSRWQADRSLATVQGAVGAAGYTLERFLLPGAPTEQEKASEQDTDPDIRHGPGVLLFRRLPPSGIALRQTHEESSGGRLEVLVMLTVPEMPTSGIERLPLLMAAHLALTLQSVPHRAGMAHRTELRVVGPFYSGSSLSLLRGLEEIAYLEGERVERRGLQVQVISGSATSGGNCAVLAGPLAHDGHVTFERTVHQDETLLGALQEQLGAIRREWQDGDGVALLTESNTGWGASLDARAPGGTGTRASRAVPVPEAVNAPAGECGPPADGTVSTPFKNALRLGFPLHIADRYASRQRAAADPDYARVLGTIETLRLDDSIAPSDRLPTFTPHLTDAARDLTLDGILSQLQRRRIGAVGILATDTRDRLFLAREINRVAPDVLLFGTEPDILMLHPEYAPYVRGTLMASSYPMQGHAQTLTHGEGMHERRVQFTSMAQQGLYNALLLAIGPADEMGPLLVDYRAPDRSRTGTMPAQCQEGGGDSLERPVPWIVVVGQREFTPFSVHPARISPQDCTVIRARLKTEHEPDDGRYLFATDQERVAWLLLPIVTLGLVALVAVAQERVLPSLRWLSRPSLLGKREGTADMPAGRSLRAERAALSAEHAVLTGSLVLALAIFAVWQIHVWRDVFPPDSTGRRLTVVVSTVLSVLTAAGAVALVVAGLWQLAVVLRSRVGGRRVGRAAVMRSLAMSAPEVIAALVLLAGAAFLLAMLAYLQRDPPGSQANLLFASSRAFDLPNLLSPAPLLAIFPMMIVAWMVWSLRTLYYQRVSPTDACPLIHALVSRDVRDRRLERALAATLGTTMQPAGVFLLVPVAVLVVVWLLLEPRIASIEGAAFGRVVLFGTTLGALTASLELGQAAWLAKRVTRLLERVRIHPIADDVEAMGSQALDWRPALRPSQLPHRLLLRALRAVGEDPVRDAAAVANQDRVPVLRTRAWALALERAGQWLDREPRTAPALTPAQRHLSALVVSLLLQSLVTRVVRGFGIAVLLTVLLLAGHLLTAFSGRSLALLIDIGLIVMGAGLSIRALLALERDHVLSKLWHGTPGSLNLNSGLVWRAVIYAGLPLLTIISMRFPEVGGQLVTVVEPLRHLLPTP
jgi:hypothetical protein